MTIRSWVLSFAIVIVGWFGLQISLALFTDAAPGAIALFPSDDFVAQLPKGVSVVGAGSRWIMVRSDDAQLGMNLYAAGARIVLPAGRPGCLPLL